MHNQADNSDKPYWSFPEYKESTSVVASNATQAQQEQSNIALEYLNFPDSSLYMIGFKYRIQSTSQTTTTLTQTKQDLVQQLHDLRSSKMATQAAATSDLFKTSTSNPSLGLKLQQVPPVEVDKTRMLSARTNESRTSQKKP